MTATILTSGRAAISGARSLTWWIPARQRGHLKPWNAGRHQQVAVPLDDCRTRPMGVLDLCHRQFFKGFTVGIEPESEKRWGRWRSVPREEIRNPIPPRRDHAQDLLGNVSNRRIAHVEFSPLVKYLSAMLSVGSFVFAAATDCQNAGPITTPRKLPAAGASALRRRVDASPSWRRSGWLRARPAQ